MDFALEFKQVSQKIALVKRLFDGFCFHYLLSMTYAIPGSMRLPWRTRSVDSSTVMPWNLWAVLASATRKGNWVILYVWWCFPRLPSMTKSFVVMNIGVAPAC